MNIKNTFDTTALDVSTPDTPAIDAPASDRPTAGIQTSDRYAVGPATIEAAALVSDRGGLDGDGTGRRHRALRAVLVGVGTISAVVAVNVAFGGLDTLGLQGSDTYFHVTDHEVFAVRDSHARFYGGVYLAGAAALMLAGTNLRRYRGVALAVFAMVFTGGLARLTQLDPGVTFGKTLLTSTLIELVGMPLLALWVWRATGVRRESLHVQL